MNKTLDVFHLDITVLNYLPVTESDKKDIEVKQALSELLEIKKVRGEKDWKTSCKKAISRL